MHVNDRVMKHRDALRQSGLRPLQIWLPDTRRAGFEDEYRREAARLAQADRDDASLGAMMDEALADVDGWE